MTKRVRQWIGYIIMVIGFGFLSGPFILGMTESNKQQKSVEWFYDMLGDNETGDEAGNASGDETGDEAGNAFGDVETGSGKDTFNGLANSPVDEKVYDGYFYKTISKLKYEEDSFYKACVDYNIKISESYQDNMNALSDVETFDIDARDYGYAENVIGTIRVPRLDIELAIYLGASRDNMASGVAVFGMTSAPLGLKDENVSIAGHRGWRGTEVFRNIQLMQLGDPIYIVTPWDELCYRVTDLQIVTPDNNDWCKVVPGKTMITLMTCHPYGNNYQRYIVYAELCDEIVPSDEEIKKANDESYDESSRMVTEIHDDGSTSIVAVVPERLEADGSEYGAFWSNVMIMAENKMRIVAIIAGVIVLGIGIGLTVATINDRINLGGE